MTDDAIKRYDRLRSQVSRIQREHDQAVGRRQAATEALKDFNITSPKEANQRITELTDTVAQLEAELEEMLDDFESNWSSQLTEYGG